MDLLLYSRCGCCLCEGLEERLRALEPDAGFEQVAGFEQGPAHALGPAHPLDPADGRSPHLDAGSKPRLQLSVIDIDTDAALQMRYGLEVPVLALQTPAGLRLLPRVPPRLMGDRLRRWLLEQLDLA